ncbi:apolipoprotein N-acyltransferase [Chondromyces apiculatus]|uniref:Apolipoprotein N-acyltransferase n=1 Tax=Chondromyces apiculatus DSM 436 TaxID=1192034 RepID=A0A017T1H8_9BACT|nr:apolipoprotein N-acyltransferase [Chondromyces apiculatus]EYF02705.1 Apolipoprotein N-acyltransferase [Chondromyces apiculatus DSM 436]
MTWVVERVERWMPRHLARGRWTGFVAGAVLTAGFLAVCGRMEAPWFVLLFVALVPWVWALDRAASAAEAVGAGVLLSVAFAGAVFPWFPTTVERYAGAGAGTGVVWLLFLVAAPVLEPQFVTFALTRHLARRQGAGLLARGAPLLVYVGTELLLPKLFFDTLGLALYPSSFLRQGADLAGVHGLTLLVLAVNDLVVAALQRTVRDGAREPRARPGEEAVAREPAWRPLAWAAGLVGVALGYGAVRVAQLGGPGEGRGLVVAAVQANITNYDRLRAEKGAYDTVRTILDAHLAMSAEIRARSKPDLIVWPETVYPTTFGHPRSEAGAAFDGEIRALVAETGVPLVFGAYDTDGEREFNAAFFLGAASGGKAPGASYRKRMLFPLTEWVPAEIDSDWLRREMPWAGRWARGPGPRVIDLPLGRGDVLSVVPLICYDVLFPGFVAEAARGGADLIVTISNDSWFPDVRAPRLHLISAAFRSVETRLPQVRATNSGISAMISPTGEMVATAGWEQRETLTATLAGAGRPVTLAMVLGPWLGPAALVGGLALLLASRHRARRAPAPQAQTTPQAQAEAPTRPPPEAAQRKRKKRTKPGTTTK